MEMAWKERVFRLAQKKGVEMAWGRSRFAQPPAWAESRLYVTKHGLRKPELRRRGLQEHVF